MRATLSPRPPPPNAALIATGSPYSVANATTSSASGDGVGGAGHQRGADLLRDVAGLDLVAQRGDGGRRRTDPDQPGVEDGLREVGVLGQEPVARVHRVGARAGGDVEDLGHVEVGLGRRRAAERVRLVGQRDEQPVRVRVGVDRDAAEPRVGRGPDHPDRDLAAVGHEDLGDASPDGSPLARALPSAVAPSAPASAESSGRGGGAAGRGRG